jgi:hypothetical protein
MQMEIVEDAPLLAEQRHPVKEYIHITSSKLPLFVQRRAPAVFADAIRQASIYRAAFLTPPTTDAVIDKASELARAHRTQLWDGVVCAASIDAGAKALLTEDMQDGRVIDGLRLLNPFATANAAAIEDMLGGAPRT